MRAKIIIAALLVAQPAYACHRFQRWYYPWPQRCPSEHIGHFIAPVENKTWTVEITRLPNLEEFERSKAIEKLKELLGGEQK
jgi:hypothetical protein